MSTDLLNEYIQEVQGRIPKDFDELVTGVNRKPMSSAFLIVHYVLVALSLRQRAGNFVIFVLVLDVYCNLCE